MLTFEQANACLASINSADELRDLFKQLDVKTHGTTTVLYSGYVNGVYANEIKKSDFFLINLRHQYTSFTSVFISEI